MGTPQSILEQSIESSLSPSIQKSLVQMVLDILPSISLTEEGTYKVEPGICHSKSDAILRATQGYLDEIIIGYNFYYSGTHNLPFRKQIKLYEEVCKKIDYKAKCRDFPTTIAGYQETLSQYRKNPIDCLEKSKPQLMDVRNFFETILKPSNTEQPVSVMH